jgi:hypothetical protein
MLRKGICGLLFVCSFWSCAPYVQPSYYLSPSNANSTPYQFMPMRADSIKSAWYTNLTLADGSANHLGSDYQSVFQAGVHHTHNAGLLEAYYGANLTMGAYHMAGFDHALYNGLYNGNYQYDTIYRLPARRMFYGYYGVTGGLNIVKSHPRSEWRAIGFEMSIQNEFGDYSSFRKGLPDSAATVIFRNRLTGTAGFYTDILWTTRHHVTFGLKLAGGWVLNPQSNYTVFKPDNSYSLVNQPSNIFPLTYVSISFHATKNRYNGFIQINLGSYANNFQTGISYRFGEKRKRDNE